MSSLYDMISAFFAMLVSAALLHFGASGDSTPPRAEAPLHNSQAMASSSAPPSMMTPRPAPTPAVAPVVTPRVHVSVVHKKPCPEKDASPVIDTVRAPSPRA